MMNCRRDAVVIHSLSLSRPRADKPSATLPASTSCAAFALFRLLSTSCRAAVHCDHLLWSCVDLHSAKQVLHVFVENHTAILFNSRHLSPIRISC